MSSWDSEALKESSIQRIQVHVLHFWNLTAPVPHLLSILQHMDWQIGNRFPRHRYVKVNQLPVQVRCIFFPWSNVRLVGPFMHLNQDESTLAASFKLNPHPFLLVFWGWTGNDTLAIFDLQSYTAALNLKSLLEIWICLLIAIGYPLITCARSGKRPATPIWGAPLVLRNPSISLRSSQACAWWLWFHWSSGGWQQTSRLCHVDLMILKVFKTNTLYWCQYMSHKHLSVHDHAMNDRDVYYIQRILWQRMMCGFPGIQRAQIYRWDAVVRTPGCVSQWSPWAEHEAGALEGYYSWANQRWTFSHIFFK